MPDDFVLSYDTRPVRVGALVRHRNGTDVWRVRNIQYDDDGRAGLGLVDPNNPNRFTALYADLSVVVDKES
jgi:hypothetical protein